MTCHWHLQLSWEWPEPCNTDQYEIIKLKSFPGDSEYKLILRVNMHVKTELEMSWEPWGFTLEMSLLGLEKNWLQPNGYITSWLQFSQHRASSHSSSHSDSNHPAQKWGQLRRQQLVTGIGTGQWKWANGMGQQFWNWPKTKNDGNNLPLAISFLVGL